MSIDEPFELVKQAPGRANSDDGKRAVEAIKHTAAMYAVADKHSRLRLVQTPDDAPLKIDKKWPLERKISYARGRQANAVQLKKAGAAMGIKTWAQAINVQRMFESLDFIPSRDWRYYPVIDTMLGCGVPRSQSHLPMLNQPQIVIIRADRTLAIFDTAHGGTIRLIQRSK